MLLEEAKDRGYLEGEEESLPNV